MAYRIQTPKGRVRIIHEYYVDGKRVQKHVAKKNWRQLGVFENMSIDEIKLKLKSHNADAQLNRWDKVRAKIADEQKHVELGLAAYATPTEIEQFFIDLKLEAVVPLTNEKEKQLKSHWSAVVKMLMTAGKRPWEFKPGEAAAYYLKMKWSPSHAKKIHSLFNTWGVWLSARHARSFISKPLGRKVLKLISQTYQTQLKTSGANKKASGPLTLEMLRTAKSWLRPDNYNWLFLSVAFGLRPEEIDQIAENRPNTWKIVQNEGETCLDIYQPKLVHLEEVKQWKLIAILFPEQEEALRLIESGAPFKRPLTKTIRKIHPDVTAYGGRKGFEYVMMEIRKKEPETVASWLGHGDTNMLFKKYFDRRKVRTK